MISDIRIALPAGFVLIYLAPQTIILLRDTAAYRDCARGTLRVNVDPQDAVFFLLTHLLVSVPIIKLPKILLRIICLTLSKELAKFEASGWRYNRNAR